MIFFEDSYLTISIDEYSQCLIQTWKGYARSEQFRKGIEASSQLRNSHSGGIRPEIHGFCNAGKFICPGVSL
jgi:hypothetical protein